MTRRAPAPRLSRTSTLLFALGGPDIVGRAMRDRGQKAPTSTPTKKSADGSKSPSKDNSNPKKADSGLDDANQAVPGAWLQTNDATAADDAFNDKAAFTAEQDETLLRLKIVDAKPWKEIAAEVGKEHWEVKNRFKEIKPEDEAKWKLLRGYDTSPPAKSGSGGGGNNTQNSKDKSGGGKGSGTSDWKKNKKQAGGKKNDWQKQQQQESHNFDVAEDAEAPFIDADDPFTDPVPTGDDVVELSEDENFTQDELVMLCRLLHRDQRNLWLRIASQFYDKTGRKVHPMDIKEKLTGVAAA